MNETATRVISQQEILNPYFRSTFDDTDGIMIFSQSI